MRTIIITLLRKPFRISVEAENISPDIFAPLALEQIRNLEVWQGNLKRKLSDLFRVEGDECAGQAGGSDHKAGRRLFAGEADCRGHDGRDGRGDGSVGMHAGNNMRGGLLSIAGNADDWLAREILGGKIIVRGNAGNYAGAGYRGEKCGMRGGKIEVRGNAGVFLGEHICGGSISVEGNAGDFPGAANQGGTIIIDGDTYLPGAEMTKGSITVKGKCKDVCPATRR